MDGTDGSDASLPEGADPGDILYWDGLVWNLTPAPPVEAYTTPHVLTLVEGVPTWEGVPGTSGYELVSTGYVLVPLENNNAYNLIVNCPPGKKAVGGGFSNAAIAQGVVIINSFSTNGTNWLVSAWDTISPLPTANLLASVICVSVSP